MSVDQRRFVLPIPSVAIFLEHESTLISTNQKSCSLATVFLRGTLANAIRLLHEIKCGQSTGFIMSVDQRRFVFPIPSADNFSGTLIDAHQHQSKKLLVSHGFRLGNRSERHSAATEHEMWTKHLLYHEC
jgi:hypothetical protein